MSKGTQIPEGGDGQAPGLERRALYFVLISLGILLVWQWIVPPPPAPTPPPAPIAGQESGAAGDPFATGADGVAGSAAGDAAASGAAATSPAGNGPGAPPVAPSPDAPPAIGEETEREIRLETEDAVVLITNRGGRIASWKLKDHKDDAGRNLELVTLPRTRSPLLPLDLAFADTAFEGRVRTALFRLEKQPSAEGEAWQKLTLEWSDGAGSRVAKILEIGPNHQARIKLDMTAAGQPVGGWLLWGPDFGSVEQHGGLGGTFHFSGRGVVDAMPKPIRVDLASVTAPLRYGWDVATPWAGIEDTYFAALFLPVGGAGRFEIRAVELAPPDGSTTPGKALTLGIELGAGPTEVGLYVGPKDYATLSAMGGDLREVVHFQSNIPLIGPLVTLLTRGLFHALAVLETYVGNYGWAIVILTIVIRLIFWPVSQKAMMSMKRMQEKTKRVQPKMAALKEKYRRQGRKDIQSRNEMNQEVMALYQKEGINPASSLGGCLPMLLQLPILYGFYNLLQVAIELRQAPFGFWVRDLSAMDPYYVLPIIMGGTMVWQQALTASAIADPMQRRLMYITPVIFTFMFLNLPSGLVLYWLVNNLLGILQQWLINRSFSLETAKSAA